MSTAKFNQWLNSDGTENYKCRAWVNFNGTGTVAIRASGNVSSITDNGTGNYYINFTNPMPDVNYSVGLTARWTGGILAPNTNQSSVNTVSSVAVLTYTAAGSIVDSEYVTAQIFR